MASLHQIDADLFAMPVTSMLDELFEHLRANGEEEAADHIRKAYHRTYDVEFCFSRSEAIVRDFQLAESGTILHLTAEERIALSRAVSGYLVNLRGRGAGAAHALGGAERLFVKMEAVGLVGGGAAIACRRG